MKVVILAGGRGTRLGGDQPKPMVEIGGAPMICHVMSCYRKYGFTDFIVATGYKGEVIDSYFRRNISPNVFCLDTGLDANTGERVAMCADYLKGEPFLLTYGDGLADIDINKLVDFHFNVGTAVTVTAVHPPARFGQLVLSGHDVVAFNEKPVMLQLRIRACHVHGSFRTRANRAPAISRKHVMANPDFDYGRICLPPSTYAQEKHKIEVRWPAAVQFIAEQQLNEFFDAACDEVGILWVALEGATLATVQIGP